MAKTEKVTMTNMCMGLMVANDWIQKDGTRYIVRRMTFE